MKTIPSEVESRRTRCLIVASVFPPLHSAGVFRTIRLAKYLPELGWSLQVLTLKPQAYLRGTQTSAELLERLPSTVQVHRTTAGHPHQWIARINRRTGRRRQARPAASAAHAAAGVSAAPSSSPASCPPAAGLAQRVKDAVTLPWMTPDRWVGWLPFAVRAGRRVLRQHAMDVIYSSGPPWTNHLVALRLHRGSGVPWVADFRDPWVGNDFRPQRQADTWQGRKHRELERQVVETAAAVILNTARARDEMRARYTELPAAKFHVIPNAFDPADFAGLAQPQAGKASPSTPPEGPLSIVHTGAFYGRRNIDSLLEALGDLQRDGRLCATDLQLELIGAQRPGRDRERNLITARGLEHIVRLSPPIAHRQCLKKMSAADVLLLVQTEAPLCVPGKLYEYIAVRKPILTLAADGATADMVAEHALGPCVAPHEAEQLQACLMQLVEQHRQGALALPRIEAVEHFDGRRQAQRFDSILRQVAAAKQF